MAVEFTPHILRPETERVPSRSVIVLHGYAANGGVHLEDARAFVGSETDVLLPDAPGHGTREDGRLARIAGLPDAARYAAILDIAREWAAEVVDLAQACRARGISHVGLVGISMGGFAALATLPAPCPLDAVAALLAAPVLVDPTRTTPGSPPVLLGLAECDEAVPPEPGRQFAQHYGAELHEYPESSHLMRGEDWHDLWGKTVTFLRRHLEG